MSFGSTVSLLSSSGEIKNEFSLTMNDYGYNEFKSRVPPKTRILFETSGVCPQDTALSFESYRS